MRARTGLGWCLLLLLASCGDPPTEDHAPPPTTGDEVAATPTPPGRLPADVRPTRYALELSIDPRRDAFTGVATIDVELPSRRDVIHLHADGLDVREVTAAEGDLEPAAASFEVVDAERHVAAVHLPTPMGPGPVHLRFVYGAPFDTTLEGLYRVEHAGDAYAFTQMEPLGARKAFPCFDEPSFKAPFDVTLVVPEGDTAVANAPAVAADTTTGAMMRVRFQTTEPLPTYLIAFAVGPFDVVEGDPIAPNDVRETPVPFRAIAARGEGPRLAHAIEHTPRLVAALEAYFGTPYPYAKLDILAVPDFAAGAMENAGAITFRDNLLLLGDDPPVGQQRGYAYVMAHELAHQWFGNLVTMEWWDDLWLNEAFANWMEARIIEQTFPQFEPAVGEMEVGLSAMRSDSLAGARQIRQPITTEHDIHNAFDGITYNKGNAVLAMFERYLGPEVFQRGVRRYLAAHAGGNATAEDLLSALSEEAGRDVTAPFESFLLQPGVPLVSVTPRCGDDGASLELRQQRYAPLGSDATAARPWQIPVCVRYRAGAEDQRACTLLTEETGTLPLEGCPTWVMPNADGAGYYRWTLQGGGAEAAEPLAALQRGLSQLSVREQMSYADSIEASYAAGRTSYADALDALEPLASRDERPLATAPIGMLGSAIERLLEDDAARGRARSKVARLYRARARRLGWTVRSGEDPETQLLREEILDAMATVARDPATRREAARRGRAYLNEGGDAVDPSVVPPDLAPLAVTVAIQEGGAEVFDLALSRLEAATDPNVRRNLLAGIASVTDPALATRALDLVLTERVRVNEMFRPLMAQTGDRATRPAAFAWITAHYDGIVGRMGPGFAGYLPYAGSGFCDPERAAEVRAFFEPRVEATQGGPRNLALALERIALCAAVTEHGRETVADAF